MAPHFRMVKARLRACLSEKDWQERLAKMDDMPPKQLMNALLACLPQQDAEGVLTHRAAVALGQAVARLVAAPPDSGASAHEEARVFVRRLMWHMNEESGNIGWGIPEAFGEILAQNRRLAEEFHRILISYITDTGHEDNFCDNAVLRRSCYAAVGRLLAAWPDYMQIARSALTKGLNDTDATCRRLAAEILQQQV